MSQYTEEEKIEEISKIGTLSRIEMARIYRFHKPGHPYFDSRLPYNEIFMERFSKLGGMSPEISKIIGW